MQPVESWFVSFLTLGEGWHNYHHTFPWDYKAAELSMHFNPSASFIRMFEKLGLAYDLKSASPEMVINYKNFYMKLCGDAILSIKFKKKIKSDQLFLSFGQQYDSRLIFFHKNNSFFHLRF